MDAVLRKNLKPSLFPAARSAQPRRAAGCASPFPGHRQEEEDGGGGEKVEEEVVLVVVDDDDDDDDGNDGSLHRALLRLCPSTPASTYLSLLSTCCRNRSLPRVGQIYAYLSLRNGHRLGNVLTDHLVMSLAKCGALDDAMSLASTLPRISIFSWTAMISGLADNGRASEALNLYRQMQSHGVEPDSFTFVGLFKACGLLADHEQGSKLHAHARSKGFASNVYVGNAIVPMYFKCGAFEEAFNAFDDLACHNTFSWNRVISELVEHGEEHKALQLYKQMREEGVDPDTFTLVNLLKACGTICGLQDGKKLHIQASCSVFLSNVFVGNTVVNMYRKCGALRAAEDAFSALQNCDMVSWNSMISAYVEQYQPIKALLLYRQMQEEGIYPDQTTFVILTQACVQDERNEDLSHHMSKRSIREMYIAIGQALHADVQREQPSLDVLTGTTVLSMYSRFGMISEAENVFSRMAQLDIVAWNAMLSAYLEQGQAEKTLLLYVEMHCQGSDPNQVTFMAVLQACSMYAGKGVTSVHNISSKVISLEIGRALHEDIDKRGYMKDTSIANTLTNMYGKCGSISEAENVFTQIQCLDTISYNSMLSAYVELGQEGKALLLYIKMKEDSIVIDDVTNLCVLQACSEAGSLEICMELHFNVVVGGHDGITSVVSTLITAYGSCARMADAHETFYSMSEPDVVLCNAYISGYTGEGNAIASVHAFESMKLMGIHPDVVTFISILSVFSHAGLVIEGLKCLDSMKREHCIDLERTHYKIMIDLLGRAGDFRRIENMFSYIPMLDDSAIWLCLLGTCSTRGNFELAKQAFSHVMRLKPREARAYVLMSNVYVDRIGLVDLDEIIRAIE